MAGRSDFASKLPRSIKRMLAMGAARGWINNLPESRRIFARAHAHHKLMREKRTTKEMNYSSPASGETDEGSTS